MTLLSQDELAKRVTELTLNDETNVTLAASLLCNMDSTNEEHRLSPSEAEAALTSFQAIIKFPTVSSTAPSSGAYEECARYLVSQLEEVPCLSDVSILAESPDKCPVVVAQWRGVHEDWPVIILNSHYDVVPGELRTSYASID